MFYGSNGSYGTWFQGEVAANYAGPFSTNTKVHHLGLNIFPKENLELGVSYFNFRTIDKSSSDYSSTEVNVFARWMIADHYFVSPLVGFLKPKKMQQIVDYSWVIRIPISILNWFLVFFF